MISSSIYFQVKSISTEDLVINKYKFKRVMALLPRNVECQILLSSYHLNGVEVGKYYYARQAFLTDSYYPPKEDLTCFTFRVSKNPECCSKDEFDKQLDTVVRVSAFFSKEYSKGLTLCGLEQIPFYKVLVRSRSEIDKTFKFYLLGFHSKAETLNNLPPLCYVALTGVVCAPSSPWHTRALSLVSITVRKEVKVHGTVRKN